MIVEQIGVAEYKRRQAQKYAAVKQPEKPKMRVFVSSTGKKRYDYGTKEKTDRITRDLMELLFKGGWLPVTEFCTRRIGCVQMRLVDVFAVNGSLSHVFEIKTSRNGCYTDTRDRGAKSAEVRRKCDAYWIVGPAEVIEYAKSRAPKGTGLMIWDDGRFDVFRDPS